MWRASRRDHGSVAGPSDRVSQKEALHVNSNKAIELMEKAGNGVIFRASLPALRLKTLVTS
jgi:hypothetical protein